ncbi:MAG: hypothetical protein C0484_00730 [Rhodospirillum sp.]|nr:hypothetical protein [Rhodospirillum sp.]
MALVDIENPSVIHDQRLLGLFQFWRAKLDGRRLPIVGGFGRTDLARWADNLMMIDVPGDIADFRIRWLGSNLAAMFGTPRAGTGIEAMTSVGERSSVLPQYRVVIDTGLPAYYATEVELSRRGVVAQQKLILPLSSDGAKVDAVLAGIYPELPRKPRRAQRRTGGAGSPG